jgi:hypothetical protein
MLQWYKPTKKTDKLAQYYQICSWEDPPEQESQPLHPLSPPQAPIEFSNEDT